MRYTPKANRKNAIVSVLILVLSTLILTGFSLVVGSFASAVMKMTAIIFVMTAILITARYLTCTYTYILGDFEFIITKNTQKQKDIVCRLYYSDIKSIKSYREAKKEIKGLSLHDYRVTMFSKDPHCLDFDCAGESGIIIFEPDSIFKKALENRINNDIILN